MRLRKTDALIVAKRNLFHPLPQDASQEHFEELLAGGSFRVERIVSSGHSSPPGYWYDQEQAEWVVLLSGSAILEIDGQTEPLPLVPGDAVFLAAHRRHRVAATDPDQPTVWLAIHYSNPCAEEASAFEKEPSP